MSEAQSRPSFDAEFLGSVCYTTFFPEAQNPSPDLDERWSDDLSSDLDSGASSGHYDWPPERLEVACKLIARLTQSTVFDKAIKRYYELSQVAIIAAPLILNALPSLRAHLQELWSKSDTEQNVAQTRKVFV